MRILLAVAFVVVTSVAAFTYRDLILKTAVQPVRVIPMTAAVQQGVVQAPVIAPAVMDSLSALESVISTYYEAVQADSLNTTAMIDLAFLYMQHDRFDSAVGPLARAREIDPSDDLLNRLVRLAVARSGQGYIDLDLAARQFADMAAMWGEGC